MRRLLILRHAKAVPLAQGDDFGRALTDRGRKDAHRVGKWMAAEDIIPDFCLVSGAERTRETFEIVASALPRKVKTQETNALYEATGFLILELLRALPESAHAPLVVGHNPGLGDVANLLAGEGSPALRMRMAAKFPTSALAVIAFDVPDWSRIAPRGGRLERFVTPADT
jgi:phosphohistidine phosphatase